MSETTTTEEANMQHYLKRNEDRIKDLIERNMPSLQVVEVMMLEIADRTHNGDLEDACAKFYDDVMPALREYMK